MTILVETRTKYMEQQVFLKKISFLYFINKLNQYFENHWGNV
jgi:hypothetical protein